MVTVIVKFDRNRKIMAGVVALLLVVILVQFSSVSAKTAKNATTASERCAFVQQLGYTVSEETAQIKEITIPSVFNDVYTGYNALQQQAGYDLERYQGKTVTQYTYTAGGEAEPILIHLLVFEGRVIGGDISTAAFDGAMKPLME